MGEAESCRTSALIVAAGRGERLGGGLPKQYRMICGKPMIRWAAEALAQHPRVDELVIVIGAGQEELATTALAGLSHAPLIIGGNERADSVQAGLTVVSGATALIHDAARPFCPPEVIDRLLDALDASDGAVPVLPVRDTMARAGALLGEAIDRTDAVRVQTPQGFRTDALRAAFATWSGPVPTDDATVARAAGMQVAAVPGDPALEKLTTDDEWGRAEAMLGARMISRTGLGFDVHAFGGDGPIMLGGVPVPHSRGLSGHSDADVVLHAITDALLGAASVGDIGQHFPPTDLQWKGASSDRFLVHAADLIRSAGGIIDHVDCTLIGEEPKLFLHREAVRTSIAGILGVPVHGVSVKATTTERLGFTGRREGLACQAIATVRMRA